MSDVKAVEKKKVRPGQGGYITAVDNRKVRPGEMSQL